MKRLEAIGSVLVIMGVGLLSGYGLYLFIQASDVPVIIRLGAVVIFAGILIIVLSLLRERFIEKRRKLL